MKHKYFLIIVLTILCVSEKVFAQNKEIGRNIEIVITNYYHGKNEVITNSGLVLDVEEEYNNYCLLNRGCPYSEEFPHYLDTGEPLDEYYKLALTANNEVIKDIATDVLSKNNFMLCFDGGIKSICYSLIIDPKNGEIQDLEYIQLYGSRQGETNIFTGISPDVLDEIYVRLKEAVTFKVSYFAGRPVNYAIKYVHIRFSNEGIVILA